MLSFGPYPDPLNPPDGVSVSEAQRWNALVERHPRLALLEPVECPELVALAKAHELEGLALIHALTVPAQVANDPRLDAWESAVLAVLYERPRASPMVASEVAQRLKDSTGKRTDAVLARLISSRRIARIAGGGFFVLGRAA